MSGTTRRPLRRRWVAMCASVVTGLLLAGCGGSNSGSGSGGSDTSISGTAAADTFNSGTPKQGGSVTWTIEKTMDNWNILSADGNTFDYAQVVNPLTPSPYIFNPSYSVTLNTDLMVSADETSTSPQTVVYKIQPNAVWSDGTPINADDFIYNWQVQNGTDANIAAATTTGYQDITSVTGSDNGKTVTTVYKTPFGDWKSLFTNMYPAHIAKEHGNNEASFNWFQTNPLPVSGGPFVVSSVSGDKTSVILKRNTKYYGKQSPLDQLTFRAITDASQEPTALQNREVDGIYPQPQTTLVNQLKGMGSQITYKIDAGLGFEHIDFNLKNSALGNATWGKTLRTAMFTATDRNAILTKTIQQFQSSAVPLNSRMLVPGQNGYQDNVTQFGLGEGNTAKAEQLLTSAGFKNVGAGKGGLEAPDGTKIPTFQMKYTVGNQIRLDTCSLFASEMAQLGINVAVTPTDNLGATLTQTGGNGYDIVVFAWVNTPFPSSANQPLYTTGGGGNYGGYSNKNVDAWLAAAASSTDTATQISNLNKADQQISQDAYTLPLYQKPTLIAFYPNLVNVRDNATSMGPTYNAGQWGLKS
ncbi:ABC transporter family substrate-binding protein [Actinospica durhamensis]|uniref:ABC transporter family substrate-binding protein n=1 Tax=Actinospica durhamensis TaxID=1508375 RepID=A0A941EVA9_9ACTN|nr:ABC transporter family substrate-binding protein [Actinospica durhamensis]MBR7834589.1 ABC transporter family substrate-binding protein [Actinospica durhamensis]